ncbi:MAG: hypothetical protein ACFE8J_03330 [Candidatus Heimdallarchaeota archaeon]
MTNKQLFDLDKIKELTSPIEDLQIKLNQLNEISEILITNKQNLNQHFPDKENSNELESLFLLIEKLNNALIRISNENINSYLDFRENLIKKYKENFKNRLINLKLQKEKTQLIGLFLIKNKKISKIVNQISPTPAIDINQWLELFDSLKQNSIFTKTVRRFTIFYNKILQERLDNELSNSPDNIDPSVKKQFKEKFYDNPELTFEKFLRDFENQLTHEEIKTKKEFIKKIREREELQKLKKEQEEKKGLYEDYLKLSHKEFERRRRKERRQKLNKITDTAKNGKNLELSKEITEKIEKFKSQFDQSFQEKYLNVEDKELDPLDIIRKRKKKKEDEYKEFRDHFESIE